MGSSRNRWPQLEDVQEKQPADQWTISSTTAQHWEAVTGPLPPTGHGVNTLPGTLHYPNVHVRYWERSVNNARRKTYLQVLRNPGSKLDLELLLEVSEPELKHHKVMLHSVATDTFPAEWYICLRQISQSAHYWLPHRPNKRQVTLGLIRRRPPSQQIASVRAVLKALDHKFRQISPLEY